MPENYLKTTHSINMRTEGPYGSIQQITQIL
jgi:hypothetical protein